MNVSLAFSTLSLFSLLLFCIFNVLRSRFNNNNLASSISIMSSSLGLKYWAFSKPPHAHDGAPGIGEELSTVRYEQDPACCSEVQCAVCLCKIENGDEIRELRCDHLFHRVCLDRWLGYKNLSCPLCRDSLAPFRAFAELGVEVLSFNFFSSSSADRETWWLRWIKRPVNIACQWCNQRCSIYLARYL